mgnify:CR=1 FL=1
MTRILDLYCGMGGLSLGFAIAGEQISILGVDIDKHAVATYNHNLRKYGAEAIVADILNWQPREKYDIIIGGVPCQPYSVANTVAFGESHRLYPTLPRFFDIVLETKPKLFLMENVKGLVSKKYISYFENHINRVRSDYSVKWKVMDASKYGVPQRRQRLIVVGVRKDLGLPWSFPEETHGETAYIRIDGPSVEPWITVTEAIGDLLKHNQNTLPLPLDLDTEYQKKHLPIELSKPSRTLTSHISKTTRDALIIVKAGKDDVREYHKGQPSPTIMNLPSSTILTDGRQRPLGHHKSLSYEARKLTPRECLRIQSFPDWWEFPEHIKKTHQYKLIGEAVPPILAYRLAQQIYKTLNIPTKPLNPSEWKLPYCERSFYDLLGIKR